MGGYFGAQSMTGCFLAELVLLDELLSLLQAVSDNAAIMLTSKQNDIGVDGRVGIDVPHKQWLFIRIYFNF